MKSKNYKYILLFITLTVLATIGLQIFWNIKSYKETKSQLINEVQSAFDNSIEYYYLEDSKNDFVAIIGNDSMVSNDEFFDSVKFDNIFNKQRSNDLLAKRDTIDAKVVKIESIEYHEDSKEDMDKNRIKKLSIRILCLKKNLATLLEEG